MYERFYDEGILETNALGRGPKPELIPSLFVVLLALCVYLFTGEAAEAQGLVDAAPGPIQEPVASEPV